MSTDTSGDDLTSGPTSSGGGFGLEVPDADAAEQATGRVGPADSEVHVPASDPLDRVSDVLNPVNPADAADQALAIDDDEGYDDRR